MTSALSASVRELLNDWPWVVGYGLAVLLPVRPVRQLGVLLWRRITAAEGVSRDEADKAHGPDLPLIVGAVERALYVAALVPGGDGRAFIGLWLSLKVAGNWRGWSEGSTVPRGNGTSATIHPRSVLNLFLIGNGLSLLNAVAWAAFIQLALQHELACALAAPAGSTLLTFGLWRWVARKDRPPREHAAALSASSVIAALEPEDPSQ
jgi:hypothetical protein